MQCYSNKQNTSVARITVLHNEMSRISRSCLKRSYIIYTVSVKIIRGRNHSTRFSLVYGAKRDFQQYFNYIVAVSFIGGGHQSTRRKPSTCRKSLTNFIT